MLQKCANVQCTLLKRIMFNQYRIFFEQEHAEAEDVSSNRYLNEKILIIYLVWPAVNANKLKF